MIKELLDKLRQRKERQAEYEDEDRIVHKIGEKKKSADERELEKYMEEEREKMIKQKLKFHREKRKKAYWSEASVIKNNKKLLDNGNLLKGKKLFQSKGSLFIK